MILNRRRFCVLGAGLSQWSAAATPFRGLRFSICNETYGSLGFAEQCRITRQAGYRGLEIAPFTLSRDPGSLPQHKLAECRRILSGEGVEFAGLHSLLTAPAGMHITTPDETVRRRSWELLRRLIDVCAALGPNNVMVLGSGKQRSAPPGESVTDATRRLQDGLAELAPIAHAHGVTILIEPLAPHLANVVNSLADAVRIVKAIDNPGVLTMFDTHNAVAEKTPHDALLTRYLPWIRHVHLNEMDGSRPGAGSYDFRPVLRVLRNNHFPYWVSVEVFRFSEGGPAIAERTMQFLKREMQDLS